MKLYATIQANKLQDGKNIIVKKAQGSNDWLDINVTNDKGNLLAYMRIVERDNDIPAIYFVDLPQHVYKVKNRLELDNIEKGKKKTGNN